MSHLTIGGIHDDRERLPKLSEVPVVGRESVNVESFGVKGLERDVTGIEPIAVHDVVAVDDSAVQEMAGLSCSFTA